MRDRPVSRALVLVTAFVVLALVVAFLAMAMASAGGPAGARDEAATGTVQEDTVPEPVPVRVEVLNGAGRSGLARYATQRLREHGFDVVFFGNATRFDHARSVVLDRSGDGAAARVVAAALGIDSVQALPDPSLLLDVSVILGSDWPPEPVDPATPVDRIRRLFVPADSGT